MLFIDGGGLLSGVIEGLHRHGWFDVPVFGVETEGAASFRAAVEAGQTVAINKSPALPHRWAPSVFVSASCKGRQASWLVAPVWP